MDRERRNDLFLKFVRKGLEQLTQGYTRVCQSTVRGDQGGKQTFVAHPPL
jgi:hypothetical protein